MGSKFPRAIAILCLTGMTFLKQCLVSGTDARSYLISQDILKFLTSHVHQTLFYNTVPPLTTPIMHPQVSLDNKWELNH